MIGLRFIKCGFADSVMLLRAVNNIDDSVVDYIDVHCCKIINVKIFALYQAKMSGTGVPQGEVSRPFLITKA